MRKMALFVEGQTEVIFLRRLLTEIGNPANVRFQFKRLTGKDRSRNGCILRTDPDWGQSYYILIVNCGSDESVVSDVRENCKKMFSEGYDVVAAVRDASPKWQRHDVPEQITRWKKMFPLATFILATMEIEAWFLSEHSHFQKMHPELTTERINRDLGFDIITADIEGRNHPASDIKKIYNLVNIDYDKSESVVESITSRLDYNELYLRLPSRMPSLKRLVDVIELFLSGPEKRLV